MGTLENGARPSTMDFGAKQSKASRSGKVIEHGSATRKNSRLRSTEMLYSATLIDTEKISKQSQRKKIFVHVAHERSVI
jgi:hypothetical protein